jgi:hypothetical protein
MTAPILYKVLVDGKSCHGGTMTWSLPSGGKPGDWHEVDRVDMCKSGLHLTSVPEAWWKDGAKLFETEAEGVIGNPSDTKVAAKRVRLVREVSAIQYTERRGVRVLRGDVDLGDGSGSGYGDGYGDGDGSGSGYGYGDGYGDVISSKASRPGVP